MRAARIIKPKEKLEMREHRTPNAKGSQILIRVRSSGVCHSDIHLWEGGYEGAEVLKNSKRLGRGVINP